MPDSVPSATADAAPLAEDSHRTLVRLLRAAYPHPRFPDGPYERTADAVVSQAGGDLWHRLQLVAGLASLDARAGGVFTDLDDDAALAVLRDIEHAPFFAFVRTVAIVSLYDDPEVHQLLGYGGPSFEAGGYLHRGFDDLDWLPSPRVEEYDGPDQLVEVAPDDEPATAPTQA